MSWLSRLHFNRRVPRGPAPLDSVPKNLNLGEEEPLLGGQDTPPQAQFLPTGLQRDLARLFWRTAALALWALALIFLLSWLSYDPLDPSFNTATSLTSTPVRNWLGGFGAVIADLLVQGLGLGVGQLILMLFFAGTIIGRISHLPHPLRRVSWGLLSLMLGCLAWTLILPAWPSAGGAVGYLTASVLPNIYFKILAFPLALIGGALAILRAFNLTLLGLRAFIRPAPRQQERVQIPEQRGGAAPLAEPRGWFKNLFKRPDRGREDPALTRAIPSFLQTGAVAENPEPYAHQGVPHVSLGLDVAPETHLKGPEQFGRYSVIEVELGEVTSARLPDSDATDAAIIGQEGEANHERESDDFTSLDHLDHGAGEEIERITQRPSAMLVKTAQLARENTPQDAASKIRTAAVPSANYDPPSLDLLYEPTAADRSAAVTQAEADKIARQLEETLRDYGVKGEISRVLPGPVVTLYELEPAPGTKTSRVVGLADDIARSMAALSARIAPVPGKSVIGIELPNPTRETVFLHEMLCDAQFTKSTAALPLALGKDIGGQAMMGDLAKMPHLLVAGTTGSGKSVAVNTMILSLVYALSPEQVRFIMIDPKILELSVYDGIPHLLSPVVTDPKKAVVALKWVVQEMNQRYQLMSTLNVRNIANYNAKIKNALANDETLTQRVQVGFDPDTGEPIIEDQPFDMRTLPHIVVIVDEMAELMLMVGKDIEAAIQSIAQKARAAGIHMIMATQRPSVDVITGTIKANFPTRISFAVSSKIDSRTVLNEMGAEQLLGQGDMLYQPNGARTMRLHGPFASDDEVEAVVAHLRSISAPDYIEAIADEEALEAAAGPNGLDLPLFEKESSGDDLYDQAVQVVLKDKKASTSHVQRRLQIGYNRAANLIDKMEDEGLISAPDHVGRRKILTPGESAD